MVALDKTCHAESMPDDKQYYGGSCSGDESSPTSTSPNTPIPIYGDDKLRTDIACENSDISSDTDSSVVSSIPKDVDLVPVKIGHAQQQQQQPPPHSNSNFIVKYFKKKSQSWSKDQFLTIVILSFVEFFASTVVSIQAPFYPDIARQKGASATEYGLVFGIFEITVFIMSPIYGAKMSYLGPTRVFNWGILVTGICCIIFGLLDQIEGRAPFIWTCLVVRIVEAMGDAAFETASFTIIAYEFPNSVATNFATLEIFYGLGLIIGPTLGGALYEIGGFRLPFLSMGGFLFLAAIATYFFLPDTSSPKKREALSTNASTATIAGSATTTSTEDAPEPVVHGGFHMFKMLRIPVIAMTSYSIVAATAGVGFISANLDLHLSQFHLNKLAVGAVFMLDGGVYAVTAPVWGWICDHTSRQKVITFTGAAFTIFGFIFIGPVPYFPYETSLPMSCFGLALFGVGLAATLVSAFLQLLKDAIDNGYPDDISTYGLVSGLWTSMAALGYFIGPSIGGVLDDWVGFRWASIFIIGAQLVIIILLGGFYTAKAVRNTKTAEFTGGKEELAAESEMRVEDQKNHNNLSKTLYPVLVNYKEVKSNKGGEGLNSSSSSS